MYTECQNNEKDIKDKIKDILNKLEGIAIAENINFYSFEIIYKLHSNFYIKEYLRFEDYILNTRRGSGGKYPFRQFAGLIKKILVTKIKDESELSELGRALYERMQEP
ncbi:MAG: hypothetical protein LBD11_05070 [Candidatus Peribacteria bacterium]|nr:hypothetical protein [Candidatus Peribacteria bacterium]